MTESIQGAWLRLSGKLATQGWPPEILEKLRQIFYGGASAAVFIMMTMLEPVSGERILPLLDEIRAFTDEVQAG